MNRQMIFEKTIAASGNVTTVEEHLRDGMMVHSIEYEVTGDGVVTVTAYTSISGHHWIKDIIVAKGLTKTSGASSDGKGIVDVFLHPAEFVRFLIEVTTAEAVVTIFFVQK